MSDNIVRNRLVYGEVFRDVLIMLHGLGIPASNVGIERSEDSPGTRVRWDVIVNDQYFFEEMTIDEIASALKGVEMAKKLVQYAIGNGNFAPEAFDARPSEKDIAKAIARSFDVEFAASIIPNAANRNETVSRAAASQTSPPVREKNPKRVEAGRRASAKRWGHEGHTPA